MNPYGFSFVELHVEPQKKSLDYSSMGEILAKEQVFSNRSCCIGGEEHKYLKYKTWCCKMETCLLAVAISGLNIRKILMIMQKSFR